MRRLPLLALAAAIALASSAFVLLAAARNRGGEAAPELELTERELRLVPLGEGRRWAVLRLDWNRDLQDRPKEPGWFDRRKLASLGFDTSLPADDPRAPAFYGWQPAREAVVVLELDGPSAARWREERERELDASVRKLGAGATGAEEAKRAREAFAKELATRSRLFAVDADNDASALRRRYPDPSRHLIVRAVVAAESSRRWDPDTKTVAPAFVRGRIEGLLVEEVQVPRERRALLDALASGERPDGARPAGAAAGLQGGETAGDGPAYRVVVRYGPRLEPWVVEVRAVAR